MPKYQWKVCCGLTTLRTLALSVSLLAGIAAEPLFAAPEAAVSETAELRARNAEFDKALTALGDEDYKTATAALAELASGEDRSIAAEATFFLGRAYLMQERLEEALPQFAKVVSEYAEVTSHAAKALYFRGICEAGLLDRGRAIETLNRFLSEHADAPEWMRRQATSKVDELQQIDEDTLDDAHQRMDFARRRLALDDTGDSTQTEQDKVIEILTRLIGDGEKEKKPEGCPDCAAGT